MAFPTALPSGPERVDCIMAITHAQQTKESTGGSADLSMGPSGRKGTPEEILLTHGEKMGADSSQADVGHREIISPGEIPECTLRS